MMKMDWQRNDLAGVFLVFTLAFVFLLGFYSEAFFSPNDYLFSAWGDGIKNYYTYIYHIKHDVSAHHFEGMNYPFGELHIYTDGHSFLTWLLRFIPGSENWAIGVLNFLMLVSFPITALVFYQLLRSYRVHQWVAITFAICAMIMAPQFQRMSGHFSLSYSFFIPLIWLWAKRFSEKQSLRYSIYLIALQIVLFFTHPYLGVIGLFFLILFQLWNIVFESKRSVYYAVSSLLQSFIPLIVFKLYSVLMDPIDHRVSNKFFLGKWNLDIKGLFYPNKEPYFTMIKSKFPSYFVDWESQSYIGLATIVILSIMFVLWIRGLIERKRPKINGIILIGIIAVFYGTGAFFSVVPFVLDWLPQIAQIRSIARFSWIFYFCSIVAAAIFYNRFFKQWLASKKKGLALTLLLLIGFVFVLESFTWHKKNGENIIREHNLFDRHHLSSELQSEIAKIDSSEFQCIIALPFYQIGGIRSLQEVRDEEAYKESLLLSYHTGIPLLNSCLPRSDDDQFQVIRELLLENYEDSKLERLLKNSLGKILVFTGSDNLQENEFSLLKDHCKPSEISSRISILDYEEALEDQSEMEVSYFLRNRDKFHYANGIWMDKIDSSFLYFNYDEEGNSEEIKFSGGKGMQSRGNAYTELYDFANNLEDKTYTFSFWYYSKEDTTNCTMIFLEEVIDGKPNIWSNAYDTRKVLRSIGYWNFVEYDLHPEYQNGTQKLKLKWESKYFDPPIFYDEFLFREKGTNVYWIKDHVLYKNNVPVGGVDDFN